MLLIKTLKHQPISISFFISDRFDSR